MPKKYSKSHGKSWKHVQNNKQAAKKVRLAVYALAFVLTLLFFSQIIKFTNTLNSGWNSSNQAQKKYKWDGNFNINLVFHAKENALVSFSPKSGTIKIIEIPDQTYLAVSHGFGMWQIRSVYDLGASQKNLGGGKLLKDTLSDYFALPIDGYLDFSGNLSQKTPADLVGELKNSPFSIFGILSGLKTDLTLLEVLQLKMGFSSVRFDKIDEIDLKDTEGLQRNRLADGTEVYYGDPIKMDSVISDLADPTIRSEQKTIAIFNATPHPGLAQKAARLVSNIGGDVIIISNSPLQIENTLILGEGSKTLERLKQIFNGSDKQSLPLSGDKGRIEPKLEDIASSRAQINIFLGEDYFKDL